MCIRDRDGNEQRTEEVTFNADTLQTITMNLPDGVKFHNVTTGKTSKAGASVEDVYKRQPRKWVREASFQYFL